MTPSEFREDAGKTRMIRISYGGMTDDMLSRFHLICMYVDGGLLQWRVITEGSVLCMSDRASRQ